MRIAACDDTTKDLIAISKYLESYQIASDFPISFDVYENGKELLTALKSGTEYSVFLLDVEMPEMDGLTVAEQIRSCCGRDAILIFISSYPQYMQESFRVHPFYYLQKPLDRERFFSVLDDAIREFQDRKAIFSLINTANEEEFVNMRTVFCIRIVNSKYEELSFCCKGKTIPARGTLSYWEQKLSSYGFCRCSRTCLVNLAQIHYIKNQTIYFPDGSSEHISRSCMEKFRQQYLNKVVEWDSKH